MLIFNWVTNAAGRCVEGIIARAVGDAVYDICDQVFRRNIVLLEIAADNAIESALRKFNGQVDKKIEEATSHDNK